MIFLPVVVVDDEASFTVAFDEFGKDPVAGYSSSYAITRTGIGSPVDKYVLAAMFVEFQALAAVHLARLQSGPPTIAYYEPDTGNKLTKKQGEDAYADAFPKPVAVDVPVEPDVVVDPDKG